MPPHKANSHLSELVARFNPDQKEMFNILNISEKHQFRVPTGVGKGYVTIVHLLQELLGEHTKTLVVASHRLSLNNQHLAEIIDHCCEMEIIPYVRFLTIGSASLNALNMLSQNPTAIRKFNASIQRYNAPLPMEERINSKTLFKTTLSTKEVTDILASNREKGLHTVVVSTYNSLGKLRESEIDTLYLDEAHMLATHEQVSDFKSAYNSLSAKKRFFFTATPKDVEDQLISDNECSDIFLMNNETVFGEQYSIPFVKCVKSGYITKPVVHLARPADMDEVTNYDSLENKAAFVRDIFVTHREWLKSCSDHPDEIEPKLLVRCESVPAMWKLFQQLRDGGCEGALVCAGASYNNTSESNHTHAIGPHWEKNRDVFLKELQGLPDNQPAVVLNYDIFSEGLNLPGITGVVFLQGKLPTIAKVIQNVGRGTRLHRNDRERLKKNLISPRSPKGWTKPYCAVIIPYWDQCTLSTKTVLADTIRKLRDNWEFDPHFIMSVGDDMGKVLDDNDMEGLNRSNHRNKTAKAIEQIQHEIERLDKNALPVPPDAPPLSSLEDDEWFALANDL